MGIINSIFDLLSPPKCIFCRKTLTHGEKHVCNACTEDIPRTKEIAYAAPDLRVASPLFYEGTVRKAILRFKFRKRAAYAIPFGDIIAGEVRNRLNGMYDIITWIPVSDQRLKTRGYDQSQLLAYAVALELEDVAASTLEKTVDTVAQSNLSDVRQRFENVRGAFAVSDREIVKGRRILLVDDILTTGATMAECARMLKDAGAADVVGAVLACTAEREGHFLKD